jgi:hypothetical protein
VLPSYDVNYQAIRGLHASRADGEKPPIPRSVSLLQTRTPSQYMPVDPQDLRLATGAARIMLKISVASPRSRLAARLCAHPEAPDLAHEPPKAITAPQMFGRS